MDEQLKQRLVGAVVLLVGAAVALPLLLGNPMRTDSAQSPPAHAGRAQPGASAASGRAEQRIGGVGSDQRQAAISTHHGTAPRPLPPPSGARPTSSGAPAPAAVSRPDAPPGDWLVQLGSFSQAANADGLSAKLLLGGYRAYTEAASGAVTRVMVGPFADREAAERARERLQDMTGLNGVVRRGGEG